jgi:hypothetical protein
VNYFKDKFSRKENLKEMFLLPIRASGSWEWGVEGRQVSPIPLRGCEVQGWRNEAI